MVYRRQISRMRITRAASRHVTHLFPFLILLALAFPLSAQEAPVLAFIPFEAIKISPAEAAAVNTLMESSFAATGVYRVITAQQRDQILGGADAAACTDNECAVRIGIQLSADQMVQGSVARVDGRYIVNAKILAPSTSRTLCADSVSAAGAQDLEDACDRLALSLIRKAMPGSLAEEVGEPQPIGTAAAQPPTGAQGGAVSGRPTAEAEGAGAEQTTAEAGGPTAETEAEARTEARRGLETDAGPGVVEQPREKLSRADLWPLVNICGGIFFLELGNVAGSMGFELKRKMSDTVEENKAAEIGYYLTTGLSYASWAAAAAAVPTYLFVFPEKSFRLSRAGRLLFSAGVAVSVAGNVLDLLACAQRYETDFLYEDYLSAGTGLDELYDRYQSAYTLYSAERLSSYALWLIGGGGMISALFLPGPRENAISGFWEKAALIGGMTLVGVGSVTRTLALNARQTHVERGGDETAYDRYMLNSVLSYTLWALGGAAMILPFCAEIGGGGSEEDDRSGAAEEPRPEQLQLLPAAGGIILRIAY